MLELPNQNKVSGEAFYRSRHNNCLNRRTIYYAIFSAITGIIAGWSLTLFKSDIFFAIGMTLLITSVIWMTIINDKISILENEIFLIEKQFAD